MNKAQKLINDIDEAGIDFETYKKDSKTKKPVSYDKNVDEEGRKSMGDTSKFTGPEKRAMQTWTNPDGYKSINGHLRGKLNSSSAQKHIENLDSAFGKNSLPEETKIYRGLHGPHQDNFNKLKPGDTFYNKGYSATTIDPNRATHYARNGGSMLSITAPKGHPALYVSHPDVNSHTEEREMLLPRDTHFKYHGSEQVTVPEHHYSGEATGAIKTITVHHVSVLPKAHDMSAQLDKV